MLYIFFHISEVAIVMAGVIIVATALQYHFRTAFVISLGFSSIVAWACFNTWPKEVAAINSLLDYDTFDSSVGRQTGNLFIDLLFLYFFVTLKGVCAQHMFVVLFLCNHITRSNSSFVNITYFSHYRAGKGFQRLGRPD